jgi:tetrapyrrole methylase family protein / MazG family protein
MPSRQTLAEFERIVNIIEKLRSPSGCPWDRRQTRPDVARYVLDEACEVIDAIDEESPEHLKEELGDLLFQIFFLARMAEEEGAYHIGDVMAAASEKMIRRHPHVFGDARADTVEKVRENWEEIKRRERQGQPRPHSVLERVPRSLPALDRAFKITEKAARVGFDWNSIDGVIDKVEEELRELETALAENDAEKTGEELGDLLFSVVNLCRHAHVDPDRALRGATRKFTDRFTFIEERLSAEGKTPESSAMAEMDRLWELSKTTGKGNNNP